MKNILCILLGGAVGSTATYFIVKDKYERKLQAEREKMVEEVNDIQTKILDIKETLDKPEENEDEEQEEEDDKKVAAHLNFYKSTIDDVNKNTDDLDKFLKSTNNIHVMSSEEQERKDNIFIITPEEFDNVGYEVRYWYLYSDGIVADETDSIVDETEVRYSLANCLNTDWDDDYVIHIRNNNEEVDYEIKKIDEFYSDHKHND